VRRQDARASRIDEQVEQMVLDGARVDLVSERA
jgi:hypothetical protein